ncbi:MAG: hypothetical protein GXY64_09380 [Bacteroidales bacterium]|nr:hypothetical protein [Bacteroidales bacterium]
MVIVLAMMNAVSSFAQKDYESMWKEVETFQETGQPRSGSFFQALPRLSVSMLQS